MQGFTDHNLAYLCSVIAMHVAIFAGKLQERLQQSFIDITNNPSLT